MKLDKGREKDEGFLLQFLFMIKEKGQSGI